MRPSMKKRKEKEDEAEEDDEEEKETLCACMCLWYYGESKKADRKIYILLSLLYSWAGLFCLAIRLLFYSVYHCVCVCVCVSHALILHVLRMRIVFVFSSSFFLYFLVQRMRESSTEKTT